MATVLLVDDEPGIRSALTRTLTRFGHEAVTAANVTEALRALSSHHVDLIISDWHMPGVDGLDFLRMLRDDDQTTPVIMLTAFGTIEHAVAAMRAGATNYLTKPFEPEQLQLTIDQALAVSRLREENRSLLRELQGSRSEHEIVGESRAVRRALESVSAAASSRATVLLQGESGTGKELLARAIHMQSDRHAGPFVRINCAALPEGLIESTLFGHEKGAFTGAFKRSIGAFERAHGGTLLLDEISEMRLDLQPKLLRVLQEREIERIGGAGPITVDVRIIATTNRDLDVEAKAGRFRQDLFYRLSVFPIRVPPLRERRDDIPLLAHRFAARAAEEAKKEVHGFTPDAMELLCDHTWPGNVRELQHAVERAVILSVDPLLHAGLFAQLRAMSVAVEAQCAPLETGGFVLSVSSLDLLEVEQRVIGRALDLAEGNRTRAAGMLGINVRTLRRKLNGTDSSNGVH